MSIHWGEFRHDWATQSQAQNELKDEIKTEGIIPALLKLDKDLLTKFDETTASTNTEIQTIRETTNNGLTAARGDINHINERLDLLQQGFNQQGGTHEDIDHLNSLMQQVLHEIHGQEEGDQIFNRDFPQTPQQAPAGASTVPLPGGQQQQQPVASYPRMGRFARAVGNVLKEAVTPGPNERGGTQAFPG